MRAKVTWIKRQQRANSNHSIERCFAAIESGFRAGEELAIDLNTEVVPLATDGLWSIVKNCIATCKIRTDLAHITGDINYVVPLVRANKRLLTVHDVGHVQDPKHSKFKRWFLLLIWFRIPLRFTDTVICVSEQSLERLNRLVPAARGQRRVVIPAAILEPAAALTVPCPFDTEKPVVLQIGSAPHKNLRRAWKACAKLDCHLAIVGSETDEIRELQSSCALSHSIHSTVSDEALEQLYRHCDAVVFVSTHEGFGMPLIEAQVFGKPCVTSAIEPMKSNAGDGAFLVDPIDTGDIREALRRALTDTAAIEEVVKKGRENAKRFSGIEVARLHARVYAEEIRNI
jgi:glycosyltransferase involved in cell wall biosynthesis